VARSVPSNGAGHKVNCPQNSALCLGSADVY